ncbi:hypothetical protein ACFL6H_09240 [Candidatus Latescibacterota bacterium]
MTATNSKAYYSKLILIFLFSAAFGYVEAMIVVYLRKIYYSGGFTFPLVEVPAKIIIFELFREIATIVMLATVAALSAKRFWERFGYFIILFGIWDIFYYIWLKAALDWPSTLYDWDILFLIPLPWIGPVIAPVLIALLMIAVGISITYLFNNGFEFKPVMATWILAIIATLILLFSFMKDIDAGLHQALPKPYSYPMLAAGLILYGIAYIISYRNSMKR